jgi:hypothetical protein
MKYEVFVNNKFVVERRSRTKAISFAKTQIQDNNRVEVFEVDKKDVSIAIWQLGRKLL